MSSCAPDGHALSMPAETTRRTVTLPTEICERIIDIIGQPVIHADYDFWRHPDVSRTLHACTLTCRAWKYRAQLHLFRALRVDCSGEEADGIEAFTSFLRHNNSLRARLEKVNATGDG